MLKETILQREPLEQSNRVKYQHLQAQNAHLSQTIAELQSLITSLRTINTELQNKSPGSLQILIGEVTSQNRLLEQSVFRLLKSNERLSCQVLMKDQLLCETQREHREVVETYEEKVYELRMSLQNKETAVSAMEDKLNELKEEAYAPPSRVNLLCYNEMNELKAIQDRLALENAQLNFLNAVKDEELERMKGLMEKIQRAMDKKEEWKKCKETVLGETTVASSQKREKKTEARHKLQQELTRYDSKYKTLSSIKAITSSQVVSLKFLITHLTKQNRDIRRQKDKLQSALATKDKQYRMLQQAYQRIKTTLIIDRIQVQFYRDNFKELSKVSAERKIKFYDEYYEELLPTLERRLKEKQQIIAYWKHWAELTTTTNGRSIINRETRPKHTQKRSLSYSAHFCYIVQSPKKKPIVSKEKEDAIFSFINETHNVDSMINYTIDAQNPLKETPQGFNDDISVIFKPKVADTRGKSKKKIEE